MRPLSTTTTNVLVPKTNYYSKIEIIQYKPLWDSRNKNNSYFILNQKFLCVKKAYGGSYIRIGEV